MPSSKKELNFIWFYKLLCPLKGKPRLKRCSKGTSEATKRNQATRETKDEIRRTSEQKIARNAGEHQGRAIAEESTHTRSVTDVDGHDIENPT
jgi:hypothetical protein